MDKIEKLKLDQAKELADLVDKEKLRALLPESIRETARITKHPDHYTVTGWDGFAYDNPPKFAQAVKVVEEMQDQLVEAEHWQDSCVSCRPARINSTAKKEHATMDGSHTVEIAVEGGRGYQTTEVRFWAEVGHQIPGFGVEGWLIEVHLPVVDLWNLLPNVRASYNNHGDLANCEITWPVESRVVDSFRKWWSERPSYRGSYYLADWHNFNSWAGTILHTWISGEYNKGCGGGAKEAANVKD